ncbi:MAG: class I SAM-dependent methyltransferase, partial [Planctomycetota bacterium]
VASLAETPALVWECACGSGQATLGLAEHFERVLATDASASQLAHAPSHPRVEYRLARADSCPLERAAADAVVVAQALHWFDLDAFYAEVRRVLRPGGPFVAWAYGLHQITPDVDAVIDRFYEQVVGPYWPSRRRFIDEGYTTLSMPLSERPAPAMTMVHRWTLPRLEDYVGTWSAVRRYAVEHGDSPLPLIAAELRDAWGQPDEPREIRWPLMIRIGVHEP